MGRARWRTRQTVLAAVLSGPCLAAAGEPGAPMPVATPARAPRARLAWGKGRTTLETGVVRLQLSNRLQLRWSRSDGPAPGEPAETDLEIRRAKTKLQGWLASDRLSFTVQFDWARSDGKLNDLFVDVDALGGGTLRLKLGQYKVPFGRQELTSSGSLQFVDRSIVSRRFARGRDVGLMLHGEGAGGRLSWAAGLFNGSGPNTLENPDGRYQFDARVQLAPNGDPGYSEADTGSSESPLYAIAVQYERDDADLGAQRRRHATWGADATLKYRGLSLFGEVFRSRITLVEVGDRLRGDGLAVQVGYLLAGPRLELAGRWARVELADDDARREAGAALSWYRDDHRLKLQTDLRFLDGGLRASDDTELRVQAQVVF